jgi:hypothetical protein
MMAKIRTSRIRQGTAPCRGRGEAFSDEDFFLILGAAMLLGKSGMGALPDNLLEITS